MDAIAVLSNGMRLYNEPLARGLACMAGMVPTHELPISETNTEQALADVIREGGFGFFVCRTPRPGLWTFQRGIDGITKMPWGHAGLLIGGEVGVAARARKPSMIMPKPSPRWPNRASWQPPIIVEGIPVNVLRHEIVESQGRVAINSLTAAVDKGEQIIIFTNPDWTMDQKIAMACEAYSWVGEPYDVFEIAKYCFPLVPNPNAMNVCSTLALKCLAAGGDPIKPWCSRHALDPEMIAPGHLFAYGADSHYDAHCIRCKYDDALAVPA